MQKMDGIPEATAVKTGSDDSLMTGGESTLPWAFLTGEGPTWSVLGQPRTAIQHLTGRDD